MLESPPPVLELLGHRLRWRLTQALAGSDLRVGELVAAIGERQNLVSYHLAQLRVSGLVSERRSSADARDVYYHLNLRALQAELDRSAGSIHPALRLAEVRDLLHDDGGRKSRVLFVCTANSARSQMAEAILRDLSAGAIDVQSAGPRPAGVHPLAIRVLAARGLAVAGLRSKGLDELESLAFDHSVTLCDLARERCPELAAIPSRIHWSLPDPAAVEGSEGRRLEAFGQIADELEIRVRFALPVLASPTPKDAAA